MNASLDPLADRVADWTAQINAAKGGANGELTMQGWALREAVRRRGASAQHLAETVERKLGPMPAELIPSQIERAIRAWHQLLADLDAPEANFEHVRHKIRDVFFSVLEAFILIEDAGGGEEETLAQELFNSVVNDLYAFESMADVAAELQRWGGAETELSDLFCAGVAGLFGGEVRIRPRVEAEVEEFIAMSAVVRGSTAAKALTLAALEKRLASIPWWYVKWATQRLTLAVIPKVGQLYAYVWNGEDPAMLANSKDLDGWQLRLGQGKDIVSATIQDATAALKLPKHIDAASFVVQIKDPAGSEWVELFGRVEQRS